MKWQIGFTVVLAAIVTQIIGIRGYSKLERNVLGKDCEYFQIGAAANQDCYSPWNQIDNTCTFRGCVSGNGDPDSCGIGTQYANILEEVVQWCGTWGDNKLPNPTPTLCSIPIICVTNGYIPLLDCSQGRIEGNVVTAGGCIDPIGDAEGCTTCANGGLDTSRPFEQKSTTAYQIEPCVF